MTTIEAFASISKTSELYNNNKKKKKNKKKEENKVNAWPLKAREKNRKRLLSNQQEIDIVIDIVIAIVENEDRGIYIFLVDAFHDLEMCYASEHQSET